MIVHTLLPQGWTQHKRQFGWPLPLLRPAFSRRCTWSMLARLAKRKEVNLSEYQEKVISHFTKLVISLIQLVYLTLCTGLQYVNTYQNVHALLRKTVLLNYNVLHFKVANIISDLHPYTCNEQNSSHFKILSVVSSARGSKCIPNYLSRIL